ncbi:two-component regulator propeller domain-containing protein [Mariniflexile aquimaris]|uniref:histidine kinase n=1 Tax=Mariniflexile aquimaris TaxID=881009 RepID=A0ABW3BT08_9FLAO
MKRFIIASILLFLSSLCFSQKEIYKFDHVTIDHGLSQNSVIAIHQDNLGQIWLGTRDGLNKYNGKEFTVYRYDRTNPLSISNSDILCLEQDSSGNIWVGTAYGLNKYDPKKDVFTKYFHQNNASTPLDNIIWALKELSNKELWVGTPKGISIYNSTTNSFKSILDGKQILSIYETKKGDVFVGTKNGLKQLISKTGKTYQFKHIIGTEGLDIQDITENSSGVLFLGTRTQSVLKYDIVKQKVAPYFSEDILKGKNRNVRQVLFDDEEHLWIGTYNGLQIAKNSKSLIVLSHNINDQESINDNFIKSIYKDKHGSIWIGTYHGGVSIWDKSNVNFINIIQKPGGFGLSYKAVSSIINYKHFIYFGTEGGGISVLNTKTLTYHYINTTKTPALKSDNIKALYITNDNLLWIGTFENGLVVYNLEKEQFDTVKLTKELQDFLKNVGVYCIQQEANGNMLFGTTGKGVVRYNVLNKSFQIFDKRSRGLSNNIVRGLKVDSKNNIWVSTINGLNVINEKGAIKTYFYNKDLDSGFYMTSIFEDSNGVLWVGSDVEGLFKLEGNSFKSVDLKIDNAPLIGVRSIVEDGRGFFWISSSNQGLVYYDPVGKNVIANYTQKEGLANSQFNNNASLRMGNYNLFFGGSNGVTYFDASDFVKNNYAPQVIITDFKIKNKSVSVDDDTKLLSHTIAFTNDIELSYEQGNFNISFSIPNFINSNSNSYQYRLKGLENEWNETSQNSVNYTIQNPGDYIFEVKGVNNDGVSNSVPTTLNIRVNPAPWRTWWAFLIYGVVIFMALYYLLNILKSKEKLRHQLSLEKLEVEHTKEVNKAKLEFFTNISHEFRTPLTLILGPLHQVLENYKGSSTMYKKLKVIESSANHLLQLINRLMDFRKLENNIISLEAAEGNIVKFLKEIYLSFSVYAKDGNYKYHFYTPSEEILVYYDRYKLERVFYNLISNAFRYTPKKGTIIIRIIKEDDVIRIQVEDSGVGLAKEYQDKIFERFFELPINNKPDSDYNKGTGIGLSIVKNIVDLHKGKISVRNNEVTGSIFMVELPLGRAHLEDSEILKDFKFSDDLSQYVNQLEEQPTIIEKEDFFEELDPKLKPTILLVEDNKPLRKFMRDLLRDNYQILEAENGKVAYKMAIKESVDLIVSDVIMPEMTGTELCVTIKEDIRTSHIPLILLTSRSSLIYRLEGLEKGADDYISKPFNVKEFKLRIKNILNSVARLKQKLNSSDVIPSEDISISSLDDKLYKKALQIVENNIGNEQFDVLFFCEELGVSRTVLFKKIKAWTDFTPNEFVQHIRLKKSAQFLEQGHMNISQVSYKLGFKNPKYFSKCFRKKFGKTPTEYMKTFTDY